MKRLLIALLLLSSLMLVAGCQRGSGTETPDGVIPTFTPPPPMSTPPTPSLGESVNDGFGIGADDAVPTPVAGGEATPDPNLSFGGRFNELRFATSGNGVPQANFPEGTEEIYAIWNYDGMSASDTMARVWYHNGAQYVEVKENWDYTKYGSVGAVRDVYLYDYIDGIDSGNYRVELFLNDELQLSQDFTVGGP